MKISIIGSGNVAFHLGTQLKKKHFVLNEIISRTPVNAQLLAEKLQTNFTSDFINFKKDSPLFIIAVKDSAIPSVSEQLAQHIDNQIVVHTSGSVPSSVLKPFFKNYGALYPLQTFSKQSKPDFKKIPIFINANTIENLNFIKKIAQRIALNVHELPDEKRVILHMAAVFVNNFTNHLYTIGEKILKENDLPFDILKPLIEETVLKIKDNSPRGMQTGPAFRGDMETIEKHLEFLKENNLEFYNIYKILTDSILSLK